MLIETSIVAFIGGRLPATSDTFTHLIGDGRSARPQGIFIKSFTRIEPQQEVPPARSALTVGELDRQHPGLRWGRLWRRPSQSIPIAISTALAGDHPSLSHPLVARVEDQIGEGFGQRATGELRQTA